MLNHMQHAHGQTTQKNFGELNIVDCVIALLNTKRSLQVFFNYFSFQFQLFLIAPTCAVTATVIIIWQVIPTTLWIPTTNSEIKSLVLQVE